MDKVTMDMSEARAQARQLVKTGWKRAGKRGYMTFDGDYWLVCMFIVRAQDVITRADFFRTK